MLGFFHSKRFWKRTAIGFAVLVAVLFIINGVMAWRVERRLQNKLAEIRAAGDPASIADLAPEPIPDEVNAAAKLKQITPHLEEFSKEYGNFFNTPIGKAYEEAGDRGEPTTAEQLAAIGAILDRYPDLDRGIAELASYKTYASLADFSLAPQEFISETINDASDIRIVARYLDWKMQVLTAKGQAAEAFERGIELLRIAKLYESEPALVHFLVAIAMRGVATPPLYDALNAGPVSSQLHQQLDEELASHDDPERIVNALRKERAISANFTSSIGLSPSEFQTNQLLLRLIGWPVKRLYIGALESYDEQIQLATRPWHVIRKQFSPMGKTPPASDHGVLADLLLPSFRAAHEAQARNLALLRSLRIYNKLRQFAEQNGHEATSLDDLALPKAATLDPYTGQPLKLKLTDDGWIVYSVAENGIDDGGDFKDQRDFGVAPPPHRVY